MEVFLNTTQTETAVNSANVLPADNVLHASTTNSQEDSNLLARRIVDIAEEKQAINILLLDIREQSSIADYFVIATVDNERQARAIESDLLRQLRIEPGVRPLGLEGTGTSGNGWSLFDYGDVIVHLFTEESRAHYDLEGLWHEASVVMKVL